VRRRRPRRPRDGRREIIGLDLGEAETEAFWREFLRSLIARGLHGVELVVSDAHERLKKAIARTLSCPWQRCTVHFLRDCLGHARRDQHGLLAALIRPILNQPDRAEASARLAEAVGQLERPLPKVARILERTEEEILAFYGFPPEHWRKLRSTDEKIEGAAASTAPGAALACWLGVVDPRAKRRIWGFVLPHSLPRRGP
jgi:putative transposase